jgi:hypothetical protein
MKRATIPLFLCAVSAVLVALCPCGSLVEIATAQRRHPRRVPSTSSGVSKAQQAPRGPADKYSHFLHSSEKHKSLACNACHKLPTTWTAKRDFPDVADFPDHDACVRCHRQQFFTGQAFAGTGPVICTTCHPRAPPREDGRFAFGKPNNAAQTLKPIDERQFKIEFPHDKHQNVIALLRSLRAPEQTALALLDPQAVPPISGARLMTASFTRAEDDQKANYNNCTICHVTNTKPISAPTAGWPDAFVPPAGTFKTQPNSHDECFDCHWKSQKPTSDDCVGCHKPVAPPFVPVDSPKRISIKYNHEGGKTNHFEECTTCHINITRASTLEGLGPDVPIFKCVTCHQNSKTVTWKTIGTIETEILQFKKTGNCTYCHTSDVGKRKAPLSHEAAVP